MWVFICQRMSHKRCVLNKIFAYDETEKLWKIHWIPFPVHAKYSHDDNAIEGHQIVISICLWNLMKAMHYKIVSRMPHNSGFNSTHLELFSITVRSSFWMAVFMVLFLWFEHGNEKKGLIEIIKIMNTNSN